MQKFMSRLFRFFQGRYGLDSFGKFLLLLYLALLIPLSIVGIFVKHPIVELIRLILLLLPILFLFRFLSRNPVKRRIGNERYLKVKGATLAFFKLQHDKFRDRKTHIYRKCPYCRAVLRLKRIKGKHRAACPHCGKSFNVRV